MIETRDLSCTFSEGSFSQNRFTAVSPISAVFKNGGRYAIVGESGSGKTTLARMIAGLQNRMAEMYILIICRYMAGAIKPGRNILRECRLSNKIPLRHWIPRCL